MPKGDPARRDKWMARMRDWQRLAGSAHDAWVRSVCSQMAAQAGMIAALWEKW